MIPRRLSPKAEELLRRLEEREAKAKAPQGKPPAKTPTTTSGLLMSPEALEKMLGPDKTTRRRRR